MYVILRSIEFKRDAADSTNCAPNVIVKSRLIVRCNKWSTVLCRKDYVVEKIGVRVGHSFLVKLSPASRATLSHGLASWGSLRFTPGFMLSPAPQAKTLFDA